MKPKKHRFTTRGILLVAFLLMTEIPILIASFLYYGTEANVLIENEKQYERQMVADVLGSYGALYPQLDQIKYEVASQLTAMNLTQLDFNHYSTAVLSNVRVLENLMQSIRRTVSGIVSITLINPEGRTLVFSSQASMNKERLLEKSWVQETYTDYQWRLIPEHRADYYLPLQSYQSVTTFISGLADPNMDGVFEYIIQIDLSMDFLDELFSRAVLDPAEVLLLLRGDGMVLVEHNYAENAERESLDAYFAAVDKEITFLPEGNRMLVALRDESLDLTLYKLKPLGSLANTRGLLLKIVTVVAISTLIAVLLSLLVTSSVTRPIRQLRDSLNRMLTVDQSLEPVLLDTANSDIAALSNSFDILVERINQLIVNVKRQERARKKVEVRMLQAQINPHFLYNTLNSIKWQALMARQTDIADSIVSLVYILEFCCKDIEEMATAETELEFLGKYLHLQRIRYGDRIRIELDIEPGIHLLYIPKFTLQPAVENALTHGFDAQSVDPVIRIRGFLEGKQLVFTIRDNGKGFDPTSKKFLTGIGLKNVNDRIHIAFGEAYGQTVESAVGQGTTITIRLPVITQPESVEEESHV